MRFDMSASVYFAIVMAISAFTMAVFLVRECGRRRRVDWERALLREIIEALPGGFVAWDADDRLVMHDAEFVRAYNLSTDAIRPGARFEDVIRAGVRAGQYVDAVDHEDFVRKTIEDHRLGGQVFERRMPDGSWLLVSEKRMAGGGIVGVRTDITALKRVEAALAAAIARAEHLARHDPLTGLPNRAAFDVALASACAAPGTSALLCIDLDGFKAVNDRLGHAAGDAVLRQAADRLRDVAASAMVARLGGDEFAVVVSEASDPTQSEFMAECLVRTLQRPYRFGESCITDVGASIGLAFDVGQGPEALARAADDALYVAKQAGRRTWRKSEQRNWLAA
ncbi:sensor domain-containing diguanylate cyclase [uncultured Methylobacterium sp.]|uniref:sensor domain-containing diguanylate cyclase n=2 Tax=Methylobacterium TaxID=407 RepID=UPI002599109A|nr:sensor domain-containing diguanylate cyclase [uncultured Methylobacterium sp.]